MANKKTTTKAAETIEEAKDTKKTVEPENKEAVKKDVKTVFGGTLNIRKEPTTEADIVGTLADGTKVTALEDLGEWLKVDKGYIMAKWVK